jgi:hypothetical protein
VSNTRNIRVAAATGRTRFRGQAPTNSSLLLIEGENVDDATVEQDHTELVAADQVVDQVPIPITPPPPPQPPTPPAP